MSECVIDSEISIHNGIRIGGIFMLMTLIVASIIGYYYGTKSEAAFNEGASDRYTQNYNNGYNDGVADGNQSGYEIGYYTGYYVGFSDGRSNASENERIISKISPTIDGYIDDDEWINASVYMEPFITNDGASSPSPNYYSIGYNDSHIFVLIDYCNNKITSMQGDWFELYLTDGTSFTERNYKVLLNSRIESLSYNIDSITHSFSENDIKVNEKEYALNDHFTHITYNASDSSSFWNERTAYEDNIYYTLMMNNTSNERVTLQVNLSINIYEFMSYNFPMLDIDDIYDVLNNTDDINVILTLGLMDDQHDFITDESATISITGSSFNDIQKGPEKETIDIPISTHSITNGTINISIACTYNGTFSLYIDRTSLRIGDPRWRYTSCINTISHPHVAVGFFPSPMESDPHKIIEIAVPRSEIPLIHPDEIGILFAINKISQKDYDTYYPYDIENGMWIGGIFNEPWNYASYMIYNLTEGITGA